MVNGTLTLRGAAMNLNVTPEIHLNQQQAANPTQQSRHDVYYIYVEKRKPPINHFII